MPVIKIYHQETLDTVIKSCADEIVTDLQTMMQTKLKADPAKCQIIITSCIIVAPLPIYVDMQFRANNYRNHDVINSSMQDISHILASKIGAGIRIRAFDIDQSKLHALDTEFQVGS